MTHLRYPDTEQTRIETDADIIATLTRKGWESYTPEPPPEPPPLTPLEILARDGVEVEPGVVLGASETDVQQWSRLQVHLDGKHEKASKDSGLTWEQVRPAFDGAPIEVRRKGGAPWATTVGAVRSAITVVGDAYLAAWAASNS